MRRDCVVLGCVVALWSAIVAQASAEPAAARVVRVKGGLAVQDALDQPWRVPAEGEELPAACGLKTFDGGPCMVDIAAGGSLTLASNSRARFDAANNEVELTAGKVFVRLDDKATWKVRLGETVVTLRGPAAAQCAFDAGKPGVAVCEGAADVAIAQASVHLAAGEKLVWKPGAAAPEAAATTEAERKAVSRWAARPHALGQLTIKDAQSGSFQRLEVARYHANLVLQPPVALVQIDQSFYNPCDRQEEGTFIFNLPRGASVSRFAMYVTPTTLIEGELIERKQADFIYQSIVNARRDPAILEQIGDNLFKIRVFPVPAKDTKRILLDFTLPLEAVGDVCTFTLPLLADREPILDFALGGVLRGAAPKSAVCVSHPEMTFEPRDGGEVAFRFEKANYRPKTDFALRFASPRPTQAEARAYRAEPLPGSSGPETVYFRAALPNPAPQADQQTGGPADVLIVAETSARMRRPTALASVIGPLVENLREGDRVRLMCADVAARDVAPGWRTPGGATVETLRKKLSEQVSLGGLDLARSFAEALKVFDERPKDRRRVVVYVGAGEDTLAPGLSGETAARVAQAVTAANAELAAVLTASSPAGRAVFQKAVQSCGGRVFDRAGDPAGSAAWFRYLLAHLPPCDRVLDVAVKDAAGTDLFYPATLSAGEPLVILGRTTVESLDIKATLLRSGQKIELRGELPVEKGEGDLFLGRLWAQRKLDQLAALNESGPGAAALRQRMIRLSREWSLLSPYTAFLVLESEADYPRYGIVRSERRRYWSPTDAAPQRPLPENWLAKVRAAAFKEDSAEKKLAEALDAARKSIDAGRCIEAEGILRAAETKYSAENDWRKQYTIQACQESADFQRLRDEAAAGARIERRVAALGHRRLLVDPRCIGDLAEPRVDLLAIVGETLVASDDFLKRHPHAEELLQTITVKPGPVTLGQIVELLKTRTTAKVELALDEKELGNVAPAMDDVLRWTGAGAMSLRSYARAALNGNDLRLIEKPDRLVVAIGKPEEASLVTTVYPVEDLTHLAPLKDLSLLEDPYFDREEAVRTRICAALRQPVSFDFDEKPLDAFAAELSAKLGAAVTLDLATLARQGISSDQPVSAHLSDVPLGEALRLIIKDGKLETTIANESLLITTEDSARERQTPRLHSLRGLLLAYTPPPLGPGQPFGRGKGGFGGMGGMGMGTFGGGMGGMGGSAPVDDTPPGASRVLDVSGADDEADDSDEEPDAPGEAASRMPPPRQIPGAGGAQADFDSIADTITSTVAPTSWDNVGGPGNLAPFEGTLDLVCCQTDAVHEQIEELLDTLRKLPLPEKAVLAQVPKDVEGGLQQGDYDMLIDLITSTVDPTTWDCVGGPGTIAPLDDRRAIIFSQTADVHDSVARLLVMLRRSRYEAIHGDRPWERSVDPGLPLFGPLAAEVKAAREAIPLPPPRPEQLALLKIRRERPGSGEWSYERFFLATRRPVAFYARRSGKNVAISFANASFSAGGDVGSARYPDLGLEESGDWGEGVRRLADLWLPWLPHRSNEELARMFRIAPAAEEATDAVRLKLTPAGLNGDEGTYLDVAFSRQDGQPTRWDCYERGKLTAKFSFEAGERVRLLDGQDQVLATWDVHRPPVAPTNPPAFLKLVRQRSGPGDSPLAAALAAMRAGKWIEADAAIRRAVAENPRHPLLAVLWAWCYQHDPSIAGREEVIATLSEAIVESPSLGGALAGRRITWLTPDERYAILQQGNALRRTTEDWDRLADAAIACGKLKDALALLEKTPTDSEGQWARAVKRFELLLRLDLDEQAAQSAMTALEADRPLEHWTAKGDLAAKYGRKELADQLYARALLTKPTDPWVRADLLGRQAAVNKGEKRCRLLLEAAAAARPEQYKGSQYLYQLYDELTKNPDPKLALALADGTKDRDLKAGLMLLAAEQVDDAVAAADLIWKIHESGTLPAEYRSWAFGVWNRAGKTDRTIRVAEEALGQGQSLCAEELYGLEDAYRAAGRKADARRAATTAVKGSTGNAAPPSPSPGMQIPRGLWPGHGRGGGFF